MNIFDIRIRWKFHLRIYSYSYSVKILIFVLHWITEYCNVLYLDDIWSHDCLILSFFLLHFDSWLKKKPFFVRHRYHIELKWPNIHLTSTYYRKGQNDCETFIFYETFWNNIPNWTTFIKQVFWFNDKFRKWGNDCFVTKWHLKFHILCDILK